MRYLSLAEIRGQYWLNADPNRLVCTGAARCRFWVAPLHCTRHQGVRATSASSLGVQCSPTHWRCDSGAGAVCAERAELSTHVPDALYNTRAVPCLQHGPAPFARQGGEGTPLIDIILDEVMYVFAGGVSVCDAQDGRVWWCDLCAGAGGSQPPV